MGEHKDGHTGLSITHIDTDGMTHKGIYRKANSRKEARKTERQKEKDRKTERQLFHL